MSIRGTFLKDYGISKELGDTGRTEDLPGDIECPVRESYAWNWI